MYMTRRITQVLLSIIVLASLTLAPQGSVRAIAVTRYVSTTGGDDATACSNSATPCQTIQYAINQAVADDTIKVAVGTYTVITGTEAVLIDRNLTLSGGWDASFVSQGGLSTIDGGNARRGLTVPLGVTASVDRFVVQNGFQSSEGGGIHNSGSLTLSNGLVTHNVSEGSGGGIYSSGTLTINDTTIDGNTAGKVGSLGAGGGGIEVYGGIATVNNTTISRNTISGYVTGSAIHVLSPTVTLTFNNSTVSLNSGSMAIYSLGGNVTLNNSTVTANTNPNGTGGIANESFSGTVTLRNSIVARNTASDGRQKDCGGAIISAGYNLLGTNANCTFTAATGDLVGTATAPLNPRLGSLRDNGGPTYTHALAGNSPALNAGNPGVPGTGGDTCLATDQRGVDRVAEGNCDIGAFEGHFLAVTGVTRTNANPTGASTVHFAVKFSDPVTGVNLAAPFSDFSLTKTGITGGAITAVAGSESAYTVTVNTGSGDGTLRLNVADDDSIVDGGGLPLGQSGMGNGKFTSGQVYTVDKTPAVKSVVRAAASPTSAAQVKFNVTFSTAVTGVSKTAPFGDFNITPSGVSGAVVTGVTGSGTLYVVTAKTGSGNGWIRLDVQDDDSIKDSWGNRLGGTGTGNGSFFNGEAYTVRKIPSPTWPQGTVWDTTPIYAWSRIPATTQYQYQLARGTTWIYTKSILSSACGTQTACQATTSIVLSPALYKWRARALASGIWQPWSPYLSFRLVAPRAGLWTTSYGQFYVTPDRRQVDNFTTYVYVNGCGTYKITYTPLVPIGYGVFSISSGGYTAGGSFDSSIIDIIEAHGSIQFQNYHLSGCGYMINGLFSWKGTWQNSSQPADAAGIMPEPSVVTPVRGGESALPILAPQEP